MVNEHFTILLLALTVDSLFGEPGWLYRRVPHPVAFVGRIIGAVERRYNNDTEAERTRFMRGLFLTVAIVIGAAGAGAAASTIFRHLPGGWVVEALAASTLIAARSLYDHVRAVARALGDNLEEARRAVSHIVGRDPQTLDQAGVARAAVESAAENFSDAVLAPVFWFALLGLPGLCAYKAINTLDSMIAHRSPRYEQFGKAAAHLDDAMNWLPARLSGLYFYCAAFLVTGANAARACAALRRDPPRHRSPNAGWPEAALAGALGFALGGPRHYGGRTVDDAWMGDGRRDLAATDVHSALRLYFSACALLAATVAIACVL